MADHLHISPGLVKPEHTRNRQADLYAAIISTGVVAFLAVNLRLLARRMSKARYGLDDVLIVLGLVNLGAIFYVAIWCIRDGFGLPWMAAGADSVHQVLRKVFYAEFLYTTLLCLVKFSILAFYWRTFNIRSIRIAISVLAFFVTGWFIGVTATYLLQCKPIAQFWLRTDPWACPVDERVFMTWGALPNIATDIGMLVLPIFPIWSLQKNKKQKFALYVVFSLGAVTLFASIARLVAAIRADFNALNVSWTLVDFLMWSIIEGGTAVVAANLPFLKPLYTALADKAQRSRDSWVSRRNSKRDSKRSSNSSRYTISAPRSVRGSQLKTMVHTRSYSGSSYRSDECEIALVPIEMLGKYDELDGAPTSPTIGIVPENYHLQDLERAVIRTSPRGYVWQ